ncbi:MAG: type VI secretion system baseplate subunit TssG [Oleispira antarctica]|uniref:Putative cytoplasmic protein n=1 Tax=Oleispira antarctica RB-8 TaxID=698738 RepID=R4YP12_OLEAN|nr:type VI secretion system baseplate subunit TssG [Oleispira antarctica]MBQ0791736.1 type VI secretion system baseplate subunit TssG [Oleispira antarctica]CCK76772.1 Putative cytoplasmic protein [Oleispira antarctica RB-8]
MSFFDQITQDPSGFSLFNTLRFVDAKYSDAPRIGQAGKSTEEHIVLRQQPSMAFANTPLSHFIPANEDFEKDQLFNLSFGLFGPMGAMPYHLTEHAHSREHQYKDPTFARFADVFHHRMISLFYRAEANIQPCIEMDRPEENEFDLFIGALAGLSQLESNHSTTIENQTAQSIHKNKWDRLYRSGLFSMATRPADGLKSLILDFLQLPVKIEQLTGGWLQLAEEDQFNIGVFSNNNQLGINTSLGEQVFDVQHKFTVKIGPLSIEDFYSLLPNTDLFQQLREMIRLYSNDEHDWDIELELKSHHVPKFQLGVQSQLGWTTWAGSPTQIADQKVLLESKGF